MKELIAVDYIVPPIFWFNFFQMAQLRGLSGRLSKCTKSIFSSHLLSNDASHGKINCSRKCRIYCACFAKIEKEQVHQIS